MSDLKNVNEIEVFESEIFEGITIKEDRDHLVIDFMDKCGYSEEEAIVAANNVISEDYA